ncbi:MAG TPA: cation-transporting P-type ATPase [Anaerolineae bacterium]|nr:cation-transporting P-type ATPase [Anaerolineae bacterium]HQH38493.1 cation-transporting P-type ATPase [Anaerolineae bacterium]
MFTDKPEQSGMVAPIHTLPVAQIYATLHTRPQGLTQAEVDARLQEYGRNTISEVKGKPIYLKFLANFTHLMAILLWVAGIVGFVAQMPQLAIAIWMVNVINGVFSFWQEFRAEKATEALRQLIPHYVRLLRDGEEQRVLAEELVPGDVILLSEGDRVSADARVVQEMELRVDQSTLSGESHPVSKISEAVTRTDLSHVELPNVIFAGTSIAAGTGKAVVYATGMRTEFGKIAHLTQTMQDELSPLQKEMIYATKIVTAIAVSVGVLFFILALSFTGVKLAEGFIFAMGMVVAFVPEGMLPLVTLSLAMGVERISRRHALVKRLSAVETLGCTSVICTDKTGTLTQNEMTVSDLWAGDRRLTVSGVGYTPEGQLLEGGNVALIDADIQELLRAALLCNNARLLPPNGETAHWTILGDPTEAALIVVARKAGLDEAGEASCFPRVRELPFDSRRKRMSTLHQAGRERVALVKGAPKEVLALCRQIRRAGQFHPLDEATRATIMAVNDEYARRGLRVLAVATRPLPGTFSNYNAEAIETDLTFLGLIAMMDPPRPEVAEAVTRCHYAGIRIIMVTGDYGLTAETIARRIGIIQGEHPRIIVGADLETMDDAALKEALAGEVIFARVAPEHKLRVVSAMQELGNIVAVTGDGVNDAPALKKADIGVAMGKTGTDVAKEAADMILTDDNFASIVNAVEEGRGVYANIKKFLTYIFTSNTPEAVPFILYVLSRTRIPLGLTVMQVLAIDLGTDMVPALALGAEPPEPGLMEQPPRNLKEHVINFPLLARAYLLLGAVQSLAAMAAFYFHYWINGYWGQWLDLPARGHIYHAATAMTFGAVVATQIGNLFAQRTGRASFFRTPLFTNRLIWIGIASELALAALLIYVPFLQQLFDTAAFPVWQWLFLFAWTPALLITDEIRKAFARRRMRRLQVR